MEVVYDSIRAQHAKGRECDALFRPKDVRDPLCDVDFQDMNQRPTGGW
jgi:hypothetical protein